jgi:hypothetical protein
VALEYNGARNKHFLGHYHPAAPSRVEASTAFWMAAVDSWPRTAPKSKIWWSVVQAAQGASRLTKMAKVFRE